MKLRKQQLESWHKRGANTLLWKETQVITSPGSRGDTGRSLYEWYPARSPSRRVGGGSARYLVEGYCDAPGVEYAGGWAEVNVSAPACPASAASTSDVGHGRVREAVPPGRRGRASAEQSGVSRERNCRSRRAPPTCRCRCWRRSWSRTPRRGAIPRNGGHRARSWRPRRLEHGNVPTRRTSTLFYNATDYQVRLLPLNV